MNWVGFLGIDLNFLELIFFESSLNRFFIGKFSKLFPFGISLLNISLFAQLESVQAVKKFSACGDHEGSLWLVVVIQKDGFARFL